MTNVYQTSTHNVFDNVLYNIETKQRNILVSILLSYKKTTNTDYENLLSKEMLIEFLKNYSKDNTETECINRIFEKYNLFKPYEELSESINLIGGKESINKYHGFFTCMYVETCSLFTFSDKYIFILSMYVDINNLTDIERRSKICYDRILKENKKTKEAIKYSIENFFKKNCLSDVHEEKYQRILFNDNIFNEFIELFEEIKKSPGDINLLFNELNYMYYNSDENDIYLCKDIEIKCDDILFEILMKINDTNNKHKEIIFKSFFNWILNHDMEENNIFSYLICSEKKNILYKYKKYDTIGKFTELIQRINNIASTGDVEIYNDKYDDFLTNARNNIYSGDSKIEKVDKEDDCNLNFSKFLFDNKILYDYNEYKDKKTLLYKDKDGCKVTYRQVVKVKILKIFANNGVNSKETLLKKYKNLDLPEHIIDNIEDYLNF